MNKKGKWISLFLLAFLFAARAEEKPKKKINDLRQYEEKIESQRTRLRGLRKKEKTLHSELQRYSQKIERLGKELKDLELNLGQVDTQASQTASHIDSLERAIRRTEQDVGDRLRDIYMWKKPTYLKVLLSAHGLTDFQRRYWYVQRWIYEDRKVLQKHQLAVAELTDERQSLRKHRVVLDKGIAQAGAKRKQLEGESKSRTNLLAVVKTQRDFYQKSIQDLEVAARNLQALVEELRRKEVEGDSAFARMRGRLPLPVRGKLEKRFGAYTDSKINAKLHHKGIDLRVTHGTPVAAVFDGKVVYADWFVGYGKVVIVDHGGGFFSLYAHLNEALKPLGSDVTVGEVIGSVGDTGSLKGSYLYFELRNKGITEDPWPWFAAAGRTK